MARIHIAEIVKKFEDNGIYSLTDETSCIGYKSSNNMANIFYSLHLLNFDEESEDRTAPRITIHDRVLLLILAKYGVLNLEDLRFAVEQRKLEEKETAITLNKGNADLKQMLDQRLVNKGLAMRARIIQNIKNEDGSEMNFVFYVYAITTSGLTLVNKSMDKNFKDYVGDRLMEDLNIRDKIGRMAISHASLFLEKFSYKALSSRFSRTRNSYENYPMVMYSKQDNVEIVLQYLYFVRNPMLETEDEFNEKIHNIVHNMFRWLSTDSELEKNGKIAKRKVVLVCNSLLDYDKFLSTLIRDFQKKDYFKYVKDVYATSVGFMDSATSLNDAMYHHKNIKEVNERLQPCDDEVEFDLD